MCIYLIDPLNAPICYSQEGKEMYIAYLPECREDFEYIFEHLNEYFPSPYPSTNHMMTEYGVGVLRSYIEQGSYSNKVRIYWGDKKMFPSTANTIQEFHEQYRQLRLQIML